MIPSYGTRCVAPPNLSGATAYRKRSNLLKRLVPRGWALQFHNFNGLRRGAKTKAPVVSLCFSSLNSHPESIVLKREPRAAGTPTRGNSVCATLTIDHVPINPPELLQVQTTDVIAIHFRRDPRLTIGPDECAWCEVDGRRFEIPIAPQRFGPSGRKLPRRPNAGTVSRLVVKLVAAGYAGRQFEAHDGRMVCLSGVIDLNAVSAAYGGSREKQEGE